MTHIHGQGLRKVGHLFHGIGKSQMVDFSTFNFQLFLYRNGRFLSILAPALVCFITGMSFSLQLKKQTSNTCVQAMAEGQTHGYQRPLSFKNKPIHPSFTFVLFQAILSAVLKCFSVFMFESFRITLKGLHLQLL